jgi:hypothetical protein
MPIKVGVLSQKNELVSSSQKITAAFLRHAACLADRLKEKPSSFFFSQNTFKNVHQIKTCKSKLQNLPVADPVQHLFIACIDKFSFNARRIKQALFFVKLLPQNFDSKQFEKKYSNLMRMQICQAASLFNLNCFPFFSF